MSHRNAFGLVLLIPLVLLLVASGVRAAPLNADHVPADVKYLVHVDMRAMLNSDFGKLVVEKKKEMGLEAKLFAAEQFLGLNPLYDFQGATLFGDGFEEDDATLLVYLDDDTGNLPDLVRKAQGYERHEYREHVIHSYIELRRGEKRKYAGVHEQQGVTGQILIFSSDKANVEGAVDLLIGHGGETLSRRADHVTTTDPSAGSWLFIAGDGLTDLPRHGRRARLMRTMQSLVVDIGEDADDRVHVNATMTAVDPERAKSTQEMMVGAMAMARLGDAPESVADLIDAVRIEREGATLTLSFRYDATALFDTVQSMKDARRARRAGGEEKAQPASDAADEGSDDVSTDG